MNKMQENEKCIYLPNIENLSSRILFVMFARSPLSSERRIKGKKKCKSFAFVLSLCVRKCSMHGIRGNNACCTRIYHSHFPSSVIKGTKRGGP